jgi:hypothetical protein
MHGKSSMQHPAAKRPFLLLRLWNGPVLRRPLFPSSPGLLRRPLFPFFLHTKAESSVFWACHLTFSLELSFQAIPQLSFKLTYHFTNGFYFSS